MLSSTSAAQLREVAGVLRPMELPPLPPAPLVSVLIANYNYARFLPKSVGSVQGQSYGNFEVLVCDDGSTDDSAAVLRRLATGDPRVQFFHQSNQGMAAALNTAYQAARGHLIALLDADDVWLPGRLAATLCAFKGDATPGMVVHPVRAVNEHGKVLKPRHPWRSDLGWLGPSIIRGEEPRLPPCSGITIHRRVADLVFPLPVQFRAWADRIVQERAALLASVAGVDTVLAHYRLHGANLTGLAGPSTTQQLQKVRGLYQNVWAARSEFLARQFRVEIKADLWTRTEGAHLELAHHALHGSRMPADLRAGIGSRSKRLGWDLVFALPGGMVSPALRFWWGEHLLKRVARALLGGSQ